MVEKNDQDKNFRSLQKEADLSGMFGNQQIFNPYIYYYKLYNTFPHRHWYKDIDKTKLINTIAEVYDLGESAVFETHIHSVKKNDSSPGVGAYILSEELMLCFPPREFGSNNDVQVYYSDTVEKKRLRNLLDTVEDSYMEKEAEKREVHLLMQNADNRLDFIPMHIQNIPINTAMCYNDDLLAINDMLIKRLNKESDKGLIIFYGKPGTGKTTYLRYLSSNVSKQKLFIPASLNNKIGSADFINLLNDFKNSVLILEDADSILKKRSNDDDHIISNLLNLSDGMLSDFFHIQVICIFNKDVNQLDSGMLRKGRLIASYAFKELSLEKTRALCQSLGYKIIPEREMTLADIFYFEQSDFGHAGNSQIGF